MSRVVFIIFASAAIFAGCKSKQSGAETEATSVQLFKEGKGVWFSDETKKLFGLEVIEVSERAMRRSLERQAQVFWHAGKEQMARATVLLSPDEAQNLKVGQAVTLKVSSGTGPECAGKLTRLDGLTRDSYGQIEALIEFADPQGSCGVGTCLSATFSNGEPKTVFAVPETALLRTANGPCVYTVNGTHMTRTRVKAGVVSDGFVEIEDGLYPGDLVAVKGVDGLWLVELSALKGGTPCCPVPKK